MITNEPVLSVRRVSKSGASKAGSRNKEKKQIKDLTISSFGSNQEDRDREIMRVGSICT
jgi:hypothetical protein